MKRRKRLPDGSLGELEDVFDTGDVTVEDLQKQLAEVQNYILQQEYEKLLAQGGIV